jgi:hypothetical protein
MGKIALFLSVLTSVALGLIPAYADNLIVPGKSVGPVAIDMSAQDLYRVMGEPRSSDVGEEKTSYVYDGLQVGVENDSQLVYRAFATSPKYKLEKGIAVGSSALAVIAAYGEPTSATRRQPATRRFATAISNSISRQALSPPSWFQRAAAEPAFYIISARRVAPV